MFGNFLKKMFGTQNERILDRIRPTVDRVNALESSVSPLSDDRLAAKIAEFRQRVENGEPLDDLLPETFAVVREAGSLGTIGGRTVKAIVLTGAGCSFVASAMITGMTCFSVLVVSSGNSTSQTWTPMFSAGFQCLVASRVGTSA